MIHQFCKSRELERRERELEERERDIERRSREQTPEYNLLFRELERRERELEERERDIERRSREQTPEYNYYYRVNISNNLIFFCLPITLNNPLKACFSNKKYIFRSKRTRDKIKKYIFFNEKKVFSGFVKIIGLQI